MDALLVLLVPVAVGVALLTRLFLRQDRLIFRPGPLLDRVPGDLGIAHEELRLSVDGTAVRAWWVPAPGDGTTVLYFHGSAGNLTHEIPVVQFLHSLRVDALLPEYVGYDSDGSRPSEAGCELAAHAAWEHVTHARGIAPSRVIVFGHSLGGSVAARSAVGRGCAGLVILSGFTSVRNVAALAYPYLPVKPFVRARLDALDAVRRARCPTLVVHSYDDEHIPYEQAVQLFDAATSPKKVVTLRGTHFGHTWRHSADVRGAWRELLARDFRTWA